MNITRLGVTAITLAAVGALALSGCAGGASAPASTPNPGAIISTNGSEPQNPLIPTATTETGGGKIVNSIFAGLVYYDAEGAAVNDVAAAITTDDNTTYTIKIKPGLSFSDGQVLTSNSFVDAWQYGALLSNAQLGSSFFSDIAGYSVEQDSPLTGLTVVDDTTFTVALTAPLADFPQRLGYAAFYPLPASAFADMAAFGESPIGNGPYMLDGPKAWKHNEKIDLVVNPAYDGGRKPKNGGLSITFYANQGAAYSDLLANNLDVLDSIPDSAYGTYESDLGDRVVNQPAAILQAVTIPARLPHFSGEEGALRRRALSMAINREEITKIIFSGTRTPASDFTSPVLDGWSDTLRGADVLEFDAKAARKLWARADAISPWTGSFQIAYNADGGHQGWVDAASNSIKNTLGIDASGAPTPTFAQARTAIADRSIQTAFRSGWQADYPSLYNFLQPSYATRAGSNDGEYSNPEFDSLLARGSAEGDLAAANSDFQKAQEILLQDLPAIPLWYANVTGGVGLDVHGVVFGWDSVPLFTEITKG
ncbi:peptide ABC transporter substrate-binding protein [Cryobacterium fucosi]|uniref:ABC transporter substrate-binding protein n=1 Tax=Cryobacterium fucosi TaxID=1259157 RepID=A0A4R9BEZ4_9MICO|nr:ABC transporter substrate-binding protein [Cryobacterium fucosi]TFD82216.1 ABC transporter substrate-binding protein [Cryobacterium fucosi]